MQVAGKPLKPAEPCGGQRFGMTDEGEVVHHADQWQAADHSRWPEVEGIIKVERTRREAAGEPRARVPAPGRLQGGHCFEQAQGRLARAGAGARAAAGAGGAGASSRSAASVVSSATSQRPRL